MRLVREVKNTRPLLFSDGLLYCSRFNEILTTSDLGQHFESIGKIILRPSIITKASSLQPLFQRIVRSVVYRARKTQNGNLILIFRGGIFLLRKNETRADCVFPVNRGSRPVSLAVSNTNFTVFGEYHSNEERGPMSIYGSQDDGETWNAVMTFLDKEIRHIQGISFDPWDNCFWICCGDIENENRLIRATVDFSQTETVLQSGQLNRFYSINVQKDHLILSTDTPLEDNFVFRYDKKSGKKDILAKIQNSSFYYAQVNDLNFISTNAEPSAKNDYLYSHIWAGRTYDDTWKHLMSFPVDFYSRHSPISGFFQFSRIFFPDGENTTGFLVCYGLGIKDYDNSMLVYELSPSAK